MGPECSQTASGGLLGRPGAPEGLRFGPFLVAPGRFEGPLGAALVPLWALLGRLLALPGVFFGGSEVFSAAVGRET